MKLAFLLPLASAFVIVACGDDTTGRTTGGDTTTSSSTSSSSGMSSSSSSSGAGGGSGSSSSGAGGGGGSMGACLNGADQTILMDPNSMVKEKVTKCGSDNLGQEPGTKNCIAMIGLTD